MEISPDQESSAQDFVIVEDGDHRIRVDEAHASTGVDERESWRLRLILVEGPLAGRIVAFDWLNFTPRGLHRVRLVLAALGFDVTQTLRVEPHELIGLEGIVRVEARETVSRVGEAETVIRRSRVTYDGWSPVTGEASGQDDSRGAESQAGAPAGGGSPSAVAADEMPF